MTIDLEPAVESRLRDQARKRGVSAETLAAESLRDLFAPASSSEIVPHDEWERDLFGAARECGVSLPNSAFTGEELYD